MVKVWGVHNDKLADELIEGGFISIGWDQVGDLRTIGLDRDQLKRRLADIYPNVKPRAIAGWAGNLIRFGGEIEIGDVIVAPYRADNTINIGTVTGPYEFHLDVPIHRHRHAVRWDRLSVSRTVFSQPALYEIGSLLTIFAVRKHAHEFLAALRAGSDPDAAEAAVEAAANDANDETVTADEPRASRIDRHTRDYVLEALKSALSPREFEEFTADLLRALGYEARVTAYSQDGGVDVLAHRDPLGVEPPLIKVQCKQQTSSIGAPEVQQLVGTLGNNELALFVTLGSYSKDAQGIERVRAPLRLINGEELVDLVLRHYPKLAHRWRGRIPLTSVLVVDDSADL